jgi:hypothetical protein
MARTRTTKAVAQRIDLNYFKRPTAFKQARSWLAILVPAAALLWVAAGSAISDRHVFSSGPLSRAHAVLEKQCSACHVRQAGGFAAKAEDSACLACHDGPPHHPSVAGQSGCAGCHAEHGGRISLAPGAETCVRCHGELRPAIGTARYAERIRAFGDGHPEFRALRQAGAAAASDPGTLRLNHALHLRPIRRGPDGPTVQLECLNCHNPAAVSPDSGYADPRYVGAPFGYTDKELFLAVSGEIARPPHPSTGRELMAPPRFANACAACHLLTFDKRFDAGVPHDRPEAVRAYLTRMFSEYIAAHPSERNESLSPQRALEGRAGVAAARSLSPAEWVAYRVAVSEELLWHKTCAQCHAISATPLEDAETARWESANHGQGAAPVRRPSPKPGTGAARPLPVIAPANLAPVWLPHARFDHDAHRGFSCAGCHQKAPNSTETSDILIPGIAVCGTCHAPGPAHAESRCSECHTYHDWSKRKEVKPTFTHPALAGGT